MRGYEKYNFPAFESAERDLEERGFIVISPHRLDLDAGFDPNIDEVTPELMEQMVRRDINAIIDSSFLVLLPGWEKSTGAKAEKAVADWLKRPSYQYPSMTNVN